MTRTDRQTDRQTDGQTDGRTDGQPDTHARTHTHAARTFARPPARTRHARTHAHRHTDTPHPSSYIRPAKSTLAPQEPWKTPRGTKAQRQSRPIIRNQYPVGPVLRGVAPLAPNCPCSRQLAAGGGLELTHHFLSATKPLLPVLLSLFFRPSLPAGYDTWWSWLFSFCCHCNS